jgi:hypothetical protein
VGLLARWMRPFHFGIVIRSRQSTQPVATLRLWCFKSARWGEGGFFEVTCSFSLYGAQFSFWNRNLTILFNL